MGTPSELRRRGWREDWFQSCQDLFFRGPSLAFSTLNITFRDLGCLLCNTGTGEAPGLGVPCALLGRTHRPIPGKDAVAWAHTCLCSHGCEDVRRLARDVHVCLWYLRKVGDSAHGAPEQGSQVHFLIILATSRTPLPVGLGRPWEECWDAPRSL